jgi:hypothetical protein
MDADHFDALSRTLASGGTSRRRLLTRLAGSAVATIVAALGVADADATHYTCRHVGKRCTGNAQCCSGHCRGPQGKKICRAHDVGTCTAEKDQCVGGTGGCAGGACRCFRTSGGASFCAAGSGGVCTPCTKDAQCETVTGIGSACVPFVRGSCVGSCADPFTACFPRCTA